MSAVVWKLEDVRAFLGGMDAALWGNKIEFAGQREEEDVTVFRVGTPGSSTPVTAKLLRAGLESGSAKLTMFGDVGSAATEAKPDDYLYTNKGTTLPLTVSDDDAAVGGRCWFANTLLSKVSDGFEPSKPWSIDVELPWSGASTRGTYLTGVTAVTADGNGTAVEIGAAGAGQRLYAVLHVLSISGTASTLDVTIESDVDDTFASPVTRITFDQVSTSLGGQREVASGPVTDTYYRVAWNTGDQADDSFLIVVAMGIC